MAETSLSSTTRKPDEALSELSEKRLATVLTTPLLSRLSNKETATMILVMRSGYIRITS